MLQHICFQYIMLNESIAVSLCLLRSAVQLMLSLSQPHHVVMWSCLWLAEEGDALGRRRSSGTAPPRRLTWPRAARGHGSTATSAVWSRPGRRSPIQPPALPHAQLQRLGARAQGESYCGKQDWFDPRVWPSAGFCGHCKQDPVIQTLQHWVLTKIRFNKIE